MGWQLHLVADVEQDGGSSCWSSFSDQFKANELDSCVHTFCHRRHRRQRLRQSKAPGLLVGRNALNIESIEERYDVVEG